MQTFVWEQFAPIEIEDQISKARALPSGITDITRKDYSTTYVEQNPRLPVTDQSLRIRPVGTQDPGVTLRKSALGPGIIGEPSFFDVAARGLVAAAFVGLGVWLAVAVVRRFVHA
jgi:hypothetical protein